MKLKLFITTVILTTIGCSENSIENSNSVVINEVSTMNKHIMDNDNKPSDWVELYNWGDDTVHLNGLFITDDRERPKRTPLPSYKIAPNEYLLLWGGKGNNNPYIHIGFNFSAKDEGLFIFNNDGEIVDQIHFKNFDHSAEVTFARYPDGSKNWIESISPTPLKKNLGN